MELGDYLRTLRERWVSIATVWITTLALVAVVTFLMTPQYTSSTRIFFAVQGSESVTDLAQGSSFAEQQMSSYSEVASSPLVLDPVIDALGLDTAPYTLAESLDFTVPPETVVLEIAATNEDPELARDIANGVGESLVDVASDLSPDQADGTEAVRATVLSEAVTSPSPSSPQVLRNLVLGAVLGLLLGIGYAFTRQALNTRVRDENDVARVTDSGILARVPRESDKPRQRIYMRQDPRGIRAEAMRRLRTNLQFVKFSKRSKALVVTSSVKAEGKTTTAINLAVALADDGDRVILIDADLRRPSMARYLGLEDQVGLTTVLSGRAELADVLQPWQDSGLEVLTSGQLPPNPSELLGSGEMSRLLDTLESQYDTIILDSPPLLPVTDAAVLSRVVGGALVVAGADTLHQGQLQLALDELEKVEGRILGIALNKVERKVRGYSYEEYYTQEPSPARRRSNGKKPPTYQPPRRQTRHARSARAGTSGDRR